MKTFNDYLIECIEKQKLHPEWRIGQTYFNVLYEMKPVLADQIRGGQLDPFYKHSRIDDFLYFVRGNWDE